MGESQQQAVRVQGAREEKWYSWGEGSLGPETQAGRQLLFMLELAFELVVVVAWVPVLVLMPRLIFLHRLGAESRSSHTELRFREGPSVRAAGIQADDQDRGSDRRENSNPVRKNE